MSSNTPSSIRIHATDINPQFVAGCEAAAKSHDWSVETATMSAQKLDFPNDRFTHSFTSFAFHCLGDHDAAAKDVYRILQSGGLAVASIWIYMPHVEALKQAHWLTRGKEGPMPTLLPLEGFQEAHLRAALQSGRFSDSDISCSEKDCFLVIPDRKQWAQLVWTYLGALPSGWSQTDEDKWDEAIADIVEQLQSGDGITIYEKGETVLRMVACIAVAKK